MAQGRLSVGPALRFKPRVIPSEVQQCPDKLWNVGVLKRLRKFALESVIGLHGAPHQIPGSSGKTRYYVNNSRHTLTSRLQVDLCASIGPFTNRHRDTAFVDTDHPGQRGCH